MDFWKNLMPEGKVFTCDNCGSECEYYYRRGGQIIGCENCIQLSFTWDE